MAQTRSPATVKEQIDIGEASSELTTYSLGSLEELDEESRIRTHWFKEKTVVYVSALVILTMLATCVAVLALSTDEPSRDWARQMLSTLVGFAAGAIWQTKKQS